PCRGAVQAHDARTRRPLDRIRLEARAVRDVGDLDLLVRQDVGRLHQIRVERDRSDIIDVRFGNGGAVDLRLHHDPKHQELPSLGAPSGVTVVLSISLAFPIHAATAINAGPPSLLRSSRVWGSTTEA